jgi:hypothetical protein
MPDILHQVGIDASAKKVFEAVSTIKGYRGWWDGSAEGDPRKGGLIRFFGGWVDMKVTEFKPNARIKWVCVKGPKEWMGTEVVFDLIRKKGQTFILFKHAKWKKPVEFMCHCSTKWAVFLLSVKQYAETGRGRPHPRSIKIYVGEPG